MHGEKAKKAGKSQDEKQKTTIREKQGKKTKDDNKGKAERKNER